MKKNIFRLICIVLTLTLIAGGIRTLDRAMREPGSEEKYHDFLEHHDDIDVYLLGSSRVVNGIDPMVLWNDYGITSYNLANHGFGIPYTYWVFRLALQYHVPKVAVLDVFGLARTADNQMGPGLVHGGIDAFPISRTKIEAVSDLYDDPATRLELLFPFSMYHNRWDELTFNDFLPWEESQYNLAKGAEMLDTTAPSEPMQRIPHDQMLDTENPTFAMEYCKRFIDTCREYGVIPVLAFLPTEVDEERQIEANTGAWLASREDVIYLNMMDEGLLDDMVDNAEPNAHLNRMGAAKASRYIGQYMLDELGLENHRNQPGFESWHADYNRYRDEVVFPGLLEEAEFIQLLVKAYDENVGIYVHFFNNTLPTQQENEILSQLPGLFGLDMDAGPSPEEVSADIQVVLYDRNTSEELATEYFRRSGEKIVPEE